jgi:hypothetical protein
MYTAIGWIVGVATVLAVIYGLHRLALALEKRGLINYLNAKSQSGGGAMFSPFQEMIQPQIRHVAEVQDVQRYKHEVAGEPPIPKPDPVKPSGGE